MAARATVEPKKQKSKVPESKPVLEEQIRLRAYEIYLRRNGEEGNATDDWLLAEREILQTKDEDEGEEKGYMARAEGEGYSPRR